MKINIFADYLRMTTLEYSKLDLGITDITGVNVYDMEWQGEDMLKITGTPEQLYDFLFKASMIFDIQLI